MEDNPFPPLSLTAREEFADKYNQAVYDELESLPPKDWYKKRAEFRSAGALKKKIDAIAKSRLHKRTGVAYVPAHIAKIAEIMHEAGENSHVVTVAKLYPQTPNAGEDEEDEEEEEDSDGVYSSNSDVSDGSEDEDDDGMAAQERQLKRELATLRKAAAAKRAAKAKKKKARKKAKRKIQTPRAQSSAKRHRTTSGNAPATPTEDDAMLKTFMKTFSPQTRGGKATKMVDMMQPLVQMMMMKMMRDMAKN
jgi:septal ring factor EnvC (AmiA/AmiB activator)